MSYDAMLEAMKNYPALAQRLHDATTVAERSQILADAGIAQPTLDS